MKNYVCAIDFGATSGRMIISRINENGLLETEEVRRFPNAIQEKDHDGKFYWNMTALIGEVVAGLKDLAQRKDIKIEGIGVDTWGVDVVFIDKEGNMMEQPRAYRDPYSVAAMDEYIQKVGKEKIYKKTGIQFMNFNTLFQLYACHKENFQPFEQADKYLFIPDYVSFYLSGKAVCEYTICSTSEFLNPKTKQIVYSNALNIDRALELHRYTAGRMQDSYGIGTHLTCDIEGVRPMNIVIKLTRMRITELREWHDCVKLSCDKGKTLGNPDKCAYLLRQIGE